MEEEKHMVSNMIHSSEDIKFRYTIIIKHANENTETYWFYLAVKQDRL